VFPLPFDGIVLKSVVAELSDKLTGGRIEKIYQPETDEIAINIRAKGQNFRLVMSANASYPRIHITEISKENPSVPPVFCMLLRKHISAGKISSIEFHDYERIVTINIESINELGDLTEKKLIIEIMGKHSNIILTNGEGKIIDAIKHIDNEVSSVREVMPARQYVLPPSQDKTSPDILDIKLLISQAANNPFPPLMSIEKYLLNNIKGFSPLLCREVCFRAGIESKTPLSDISSDMYNRLEKSLNEIIYSIKYGKFTPCIIYYDGSGDTPLDFHCVEMRQYKNVEYMHSISKILDTFYSRKDSSERR